ncbi:helix-hairpin-helix domain-containing protein [Pseudomonadota bacterium]
MTPTLTDVSRIGPSMAETLIAHKIDTVGKLAEIEIDKLTAVPGIGEVTGKAMIQSAAGLIAADVSPIQEKKRVKEGKKEKKNRKDKKGKKNKNKKDKNKKRKKSKK